MSYNLAMDDDDENRVIPHERRAAHIYLQNLILDDNPFRMPVGILPEPRFTPSVDTPSVQPFKILKPRETSSSAMTEEGPDSPLAKNAEDARYAVEQLMARKKRRTRPASRFSLKRAVEALNVQCIATIPTPVRSRHLDRIEEADAEESEQRSSFGATAPGLHPEQTGADATQCGRPGLHPACVATTTSATFGASCSHEPPFLPRWQRAAHNKRMSEAILLRLQFAAVPGQCCR